MKINLNSQPHTTVPKLASYFGGGDKGIKSAIIFYVIALTAFKSDDPQAIVALSERWLIETYGYFEDGREETLDVFDVLNFLKDCGDIQLEYSVHDSNILKVNITDKGLEVLSLATSSHIVKQ